MMKYETGPFKAIGGPLYKEKQQRIKPKSDFLLALEARQSNKPKAPVIDINPILERRFK